MVKCLRTKAAFNYYYSINQSPLSIFRDLALSKRDSKKSICLLLCVI